MLLGRVTERLKCYSLQRPRGRTSKTQGAASTKAQRHQRTWGSPGWLKGEADIN